MGQAFIIWNDYIFFECISQSEKKSFVNLILLVNNYFSINSHWRRVVESPQIVVHFQALVEECLVCFVRVTTASSSGPSTYEKRMRFKNNKLTLWITHWKSNCNQLDYLCEHHVATLNKLIFNENLVNTHHLSIVSWQLCLNFMLYSNPFMEIFEPCQNKIKQNWNFISCLINFKKGFHCHLKCSHSKNEKTSKFVIKCQMPNLIITYV